VLRPAIPAAVAAAALAFVGCGGATSHRDPAFELGVVANADEGAHAAEIGALGAAIVRVEFPIDEPVAAVEEVVARYADQRVAVLPLAGFSGRVASPDEARNLASWAHALGPGGSFWKRRGGAALPIRSIEFGNETNQAAQFDGCGPGCPQFAQRAREYALALKAAQEAIGSSAGNPAVGLLAIGDDGGTGSSEWVNDMFAAVPDLAGRIAGWTAHPYGPGWHDALDQLVSQTSAAGAPATLPIYVTEVGVASDDGRCLDENLGWNPCMSYAEAAQTMQQVVTGMRSSFGLRLREVFIYQAFDQRPPGTDAGREHYFGILAADGGEKGSYTSTIRSLLRRLR
jgi:hypothetical protein